MIIEDQILVPLPVSYIQGLVIWIEERLEEIECEEARKELERRKLLLTRKLISYHFYRESR